MKLNKYDREYKEYLAMEKRLNVLLLEINKLPLIPLKKPIQKGWIVIQRLREDIAKRKDAPFLNELLRIGYEKNKIISSEKEVKLVRQGKKEYNYTEDKKRKFRNLRPERKLLSEKQYNELSDKIKGYFTLDTLSDAYRLWKRKYYYIYLPDYYTILKAKPNILTHYRNKGGPLEEEYQYLKDKCQQYWVEHSSGYGGSHPKHNGRAKTRDAIRKFINGETDDIYNEKIDEDYDY